LEIWNKGNLDDVDKFVISDFIYHERGDVTGIENFKEWVSSDLSVFPDLRFTIVDSIAEFNKVATAWFLEILITWNIDILLDRLLETVSRI
jgi:predicted ester cyclase